MSHRFLTPICALTTAIMVVLLAQPFVVERLEEQFLDQLRHRPAAGTMTHVDAAVLQVERSNVALLQFRAHHGIPRAERPPAQPEQVPLVRPDARLMRQPHRYRGTVRK